jgi:hypothetical protein
MTDLVYDRPSFSPDQIAVIRGWAAEQHRHLHSLKNASNDRELRDGLSEQMRRVEEINRLLGEYL